jgi:protein TonB
MAPTGTDERDDQGADGSAMQDVRTNQGVRPSDTTVGDADITLLSSADSIAPSVPAEPEAGTLDDHGPADLPPPEEPPDFDWDALERWSSYGLPVDNDDAWAKDSSDVALSPSTPDALDVQHVVASVDSWPATAYEDGDGRAPRLQEDAGPIEWIAEPPVVEAAAVGADSPLDWETGAAPPLGAAGGDADFPDDTTGRFVLDAAADGRSAPHVLETESVAWPPPASPPVAEFALPDLGPPASPVTSPLGAADDRDSAGAGLLWDPPVSENAAGGGESRFTILAPGLTPDAESTNVERSRWESKDAEEDVRLTIPAPVLAPHGESPDAEGLPWDSKDAEEDVRLTIPAPVLAPHGESPDAERLRWDSAPASDARDDLELAATHVARPALPRPAFSDTSSPASESAGAEVLESWWVPQVAEPAPGYRALASSGGPAPDTPSGRAPLSIADVGLTLGTGAQPATIESWWVPTVPAAQRGGLATTAAVQAAAEPMAVITGPVLTLVTRPGSESPLESPSEAGKAGSAAGAADAPDPSEPPAAAVARARAAMRIVTPSEAPAVDVLEATARPPNDPGNGVTQTTEPAEIRSGTLASVAERRPASDTTGQETVPDSADVAVATTPALPQPWWRPRDDQRLTEGDSVAAPTAGLDKPQRSRVEPRAQMPVASTLGAQRNSGPVTPGAPHRTDPKSQAPRPRVPRPPRPVPPVVHRRPATPATRPVFLFAALVALAFGAAYAAQLWLSGGSPWSSNRVPPASTPAAAPVAASPAAPPSSAPTPAPAAVPSSTTTIRPDPPVARPGTPRPTPRADVSKRGNGRPATKPQTRPRATSSRASPRPVSPAPLAATALAQTPLATPVLAASVAPRPAPPAAVVPPAAPPRKVFEISQVEVRPEVRRRVSPQYPAAARADGLEDVVIVRVLVTASGAPSNVQVLRGSKIHRAFDSAAIAAVRQWTFAPARRREQPVACWLNVGVPFRLAPEMGTP